MRLTTLRSFKCTSRLWEIGKRPQYRSVPIRRAALFNERDSVMLRKVKDPKVTVFVSALKGSNEVDCFAGRIKHDAIIGVHRGTVIESSRGAQFFADEPSMAEHILHIQRISTPIYPDDAKSIVSLLDLHLGHLKEDSGHRIEILECGSGHGSLSLHLAHAIHHVNGTPPASKGPELDTWLANRKVLIRSLDNNSNRSKAARNTVRTFRDGEYKWSVQFETAELREYLAKQASVRRHGPERFSYIVLDIPFDREALEACAKALLIGGKLLLFCPNISQIEDAMLHVKEWGATQMRLEDVVELGPGISGGRQWDVSRVRVRERRQESEVNSKPFDPIARTPGLQTQIEGSSGELTSPLLHQTLEVSQAPFGQQTPVEQDLDLNVQPISTRTIENPPEQDDSSKWAVRARPRVGAKTMGGGFVAVFRKRLASGKRVIHLESTAQTETNKQ